MSHVIYSPERIPDNRIIIFLADLIRRVTILDSQLPTS